MESTISGTKTQYEVDTPQDIENILGIFCLRTISPHACTHLLATGASKQKGFSQASLEPALTPHAGYRSGARSPQATTR